MLTRTDSAAIAVLWAVCGASPACGRKADPISESSDSVTFLAAGAKVTVGEHGFQPTSLKIPLGPAGATVPVTFVRTTDETCAKEVVFPDVGIKKELPLNTPVTIDVPADSSRTLMFQCGMAMYKGSLVIR